MHVLVLRVGEREKLLYKGKQTCPLFKGFTQSLYSTNVSSLRMN